MKNKLSYIFLVIGLACFTYMIYAFGLDNILANLQKTGWYFVPIAATWLVVYTCNAAAWRFIINDKSIPFFRVLSITISGYAINYVTPFVNLGGEPYRILALKDTLGTNKAVSVTISYVMLHFLSSFLIWITAVVAMLLYMPFTAAVNAVLALSLIVFGYVVFIFIKGYEKGVTKSTAKFLIKIPLLKKFEDKISSKETMLHEIDENMKELFGKRKWHFLAANLLEYTSRLAATVEFYFILKAIGFNPTYMEAFIINAGIGLINNLFFVVPFELGVKEGGLYALLGFLNYTPAIGIYVGLVTRLRELVWILIGLALIPFGNKNNGNRNLKDILTDESNII